MIIGCYFVEILLIDLWLFADSKNSYEGGRKGDEKSVLKVEDGGMDEECL